MIYQKIITELKKYQSAEKAIILQRFFKTGPGQYGEGDKFLGVVVPNLRIVAKKFVDTDFISLKKLINSPIHEHRLTALLILTYKFKQAAALEKKKQIYNFYLKYTKQINNWDLVDLSAPNIVGGYLLTRSCHPDHIHSCHSKSERRILDKLAHSKNLWEKRIAIISTFAFIKQNEFTNTLKISKMLLNDKHDLIHKAVGWMLREVGKRNSTVEESFLKEYYKAMPRTMLRYAIEKFPEKLRQKYLKGGI